MATRAEIKQAMVSRVIQEGLIDPATGQPMSAMDSVLEAVTDGIVMVEGGGPHSSTHVTGGTDVIPDAVPGGASGLMSGADKAKLNGIEAGAQVNQNAFSYVKVGATTIGADSKTDTLELAAGTNIALTPDATNDKVTIAVTGTVSSAQDSDTVDGKHASDLAPIGHGHTGGSDGNQVGTSGLQDGAVTDAKIGNRTVDQTQAPTGSTGTLTQLLSWLANRIKAMAGATNWFDNPAASLASIWAKFNAGTGHKHTGAADDAPQVDYASIANKPGSFPPSLHASSHHSGGGDALSLGSIAGTLTDTQHGNRGGGTLHSAATASAAGFMSASDKVKLDGVQSGAEVNQNAFSSVKAVDSGGVSKGQADADAKTDVLTLKEGTGISLSVDAGTDTITIAATGGGLPAAHATTHITGGTDVIPNAVAGGASGLMSGADKQKLDGIQAGAEVNQNAFANVLVGGTVIAADSKTDTLELVAGTNIALTPDATNDKVTIAVSGTVASASNADTVDGKHASDFVQNAGSAPSVQAGIDASKPAAGTVGRLYIATDTQIIYRDSGSAWIKVGAVKWGDIDGKPSSFTPSAHKSTHASGGSDALTPGDIGAETPADAQAKVDTHATDPSAHHTRYTDAEAVAAILAADGPGSGLDADMVDGKHASDFVQNAGGTPSIQAGPDASKPAAGTAGRLYLATDTHVLYRDDGAAWVKMATADWDDIDGKPEVTRAVAVSVQASSWTAKAAMPTARSSLAAAAPGNGKLYAVGGYNGTSYFTTNEEYDPSTNTWTSKAAMPTKGSGLAAAAPGNGKLYAIGGYDGTSYLTANKEYDPSTNTWTSKAAMPTARSYLAAAAPGNGKFYAIGGYNGTSHLATNEEYDPSTNTWTSKAAMPTARGYLAAAAPANGKLYAIGGYDGTNYLTTNEEYDPSTNTWTSKAAMLTKRDNLAATAPGNGKLYAIGGYDGTSYFTANEAYDPSTNTWTSEAAMPTKRSHLAAAAPGNGKLYAVGGYNGTSRLSANEEYNPILVVSPVSGIVRWPDLRIAGVIKDASYESPASGTAVFIGSAA